MLSRPSSSHSVLNGAKSLVTVAARAASAEARLPAAVRTNAYDKIIAFARDGYKQAAANATPVGTTGQLTAIELPAGLPELVATHPRRLKQPPKSKNLLLIRKDVHKQLCADRTSQDIVLFGGSGTGKSGALSVVAFDWMSRRTREEGAAQAADYDCVPGDLFVHVHGQSFTAFLRRDHAPLGFVVEQTDLENLATADVETKLLKRYPSLNEESSRYLFEPAGHGAALPPAFSAVPLLCGAQTVIAASPRAVSRDRMTKYGVHPITVTDPDRALFRDYAAALGYTAKHAAVIEVLFGCNLRMLRPMSADAAGDALCVLADRIGRFGSTEVNTPLSEADRATLSSLIVGYDAGGNRVFRPLILTAALGDVKKKVKFAEATQSALKATKDASEAASKAAANPAVQMADVASGGVVGTLLSVAGAVGSVAALISPPEAKLCTVAQEVLREHAPAIKNLVKMRDGSASIEEMDAAIAVLTGEVERLLALKAMEAGLSFE